MTTIRARTVSFALLGAASLGFETLRAQKREGSEP
jgi:hypothetical protein